MSVQNLFDEQKLAYARLSAFAFNTKCEINHSKFMIFKAPAGCGKTTVVREVASDLYLSGKRNFQLSSFTGRAAAHLRYDANGVSYTGRTLHSIFFDPILDENGNLKGWVKRPIQNVRLECEDGLFVDESSMLPKEIHDEICYLGVPVFYIGDHSQLPPIDNTGFNAMLLDHETCELKINRRIGNGLDGIVSITEHLREHNTIPRRVGEGLSIKPKSLLRNVSFYEENEFDIILCGTNKTRRYLNTLVRRAKNYTKPYPDIGERIMATENTIINNVRIYNGELYEVVAVFGGGDKKGSYRLLSLDSDVKKYVTADIRHDCWTENIPDDVKRSPEELRAVFGYAATVHKSQGSTFDRVLFIDEDVSFFLDQQKFRYTATTRAAKQLTIGI